MVAYEFPYHMTVSSSFLHSFCMDFHTDSRGHGWTVPGDSPMKHETSTRCRVRWSMKQSSHSVNENYLHIEKYLITLLGKRVPCRMAALEWTYLGHHQDLNPVTDWVFIIIAVFYKNTVS